MFDNLRDDAASSFYEEDTVPPEEVEVVVPKKRKPQSKILGMTPVQRFVIAVMLMIAVCTLGTMCLLLTNKIGLF
jgi:magnesium-transporting ATPase (P-type)